MSCMPHVPLSILVDVPSLSRARLGTPEQRETTGFARIWMSHYWPLALRLFVRSSRHVLERRHDIRDAASRNCASMYSYNSLLMAILRMFILGFQHLIRLSSGRSKVDVDLSNIYPMKLIAVDIPSVLKGSPFATRLQLTIE